MPIFEATNWPLSYRWVAYGEAGCPPVLMLHGLGSSGEDWLPQWSALDSRWPVLTVDMPGHGLSPPLKETTSLADLAWALAALLEDQAVQPVHLVGLSLGALIGLQLAVDQPAWLRSMMLVNGFARLRPGGVGVISAAGRLALLLLGRMEWVGAWVAKSVFPKEGQDQLRQQAAERIASIDRKTYWYYLRSLVTFDLYHSLAKLEVPSMVIAGAEDRIVSMRAKRELAQALPGGGLMVIDGSGHGTPIDASTRFNEILIKWLKVQEAVPARGN